MKKLLIALCLFSFVSCTEKIDNTGTCSDGIRNQGEQEVDCGGPCPNHCTSCADGIMNQGETAADCGGPCDPCYPLMSARVDGQSWMSTSRNAQQVTAGSVRIYGTGQQKSVTLIYNGPFLKGVYSGSPAITGEFRDESGNLYASMGNATIEFTTFDTIQRKVSGVFSFSGTDAVSGLNVQVSSGVFTELEY